MSTRCFALPRNRRVVCNGASLSSRACRVNLSTALALALLFLQFGCAASKKVQLPEVVGDNPKSAELIQAVNENAAKIKTIYAPSASVGFSNLPNSAACQVVFESPNKFRLRGSASLVGQVVDCGCDGENFWFWGKYQNPDELYYCKLSEYTSGALSEYMPVDPSWFPEALGVDEIKESDVLDEPQEQADGTLLVTLKKTRADGEYRKRVYFEPRTAAISRQDVQDPKGNVVVSVVCREQQYVESHGVVLPKRLEITCAKSTESLIVNLGDVTLNESNTLSATAFQRPTDLGREVDLGAMLKKKSVATLTRPAEITRPAEVARPAETKQEIETTRAVETVAVAPTVKQTDDSGATWTTATPSQVSQRSTAPNVVATRAADPNVATSDASSFTQTAATQTGPFVLEGSGKSLDASKGSNDATRADANRTGGIMIARPSTATTTDSGVTPFPTDLNAQSSSTQTSATNGFANAIPIESERLGTVAPRTAAPNDDSQAVYVADASAQTNVSANAPSFEPAYDDSEPLEDELLDEDFPTFSN